MLLKHSWRPRGKKALPAIFAAILVLGFGLKVNAATGYYALDAASIPAKDPTHAPIVALERVGSRLVAAGLHGLIITSDDSGTTWTQASVPVNVTLTALYFTSDKEGWATGHYGVVLHTTDGGLTWTKALDGTDIIKMLNAEADAMTANPAPVATTATATVTTAPAAATAETPAAPTSSASAGAAAAPSAAAAMGMNTSISVATPVQILSLKHVAGAFQKAGPSKPFLAVGQCGSGLLVVGQQDMAALSNDGGKSWKEWTAEINDPGYQNFYGILNEGSTTFLIGEEGMILKSDAECSNFNPLTSPATATLFGGVSIGPKSFIVYGLDGGLYKTTDDGATWTTYTMPSDSVLDSGIALPSGEVLIGAVNGRLFLSDSAKQNFHQISTTLPFDVADMVIAPNGNLVVVGTGGVATVAPQLIR